MAVIELYLKAVARIDTTRSDAQIRNRLASLRPDIDAWLAGKADDDPQSTLLSTDYKLKISARIPKEIYPKIIFFVESTRTEHEIYDLLTRSTRPNNFTSLIKGLIRPIVSADNRTTILRWHVHEVDGVNREVEP